MKIRKQSLVRMMRLFPCAFLALLLASLVVPSEAQIYTLSDLNSVAKVDVSSPAGFFSWEVDAQDQLNKQWFYYRNGSTGPEYPINSLGSPTILQYDSRNLDVVYSNSTFQVDVKYLLTGNTDGSGKSGMNLDFSVKNLSAVTNYFHFFQYSDFDLGGALVGQTVKFTKSGPYYNKAVQTIGLLALTNTFSTLKPISRVEVTNYNQTLSSLTDGSPTTLSNSAAYGPGNATYTAQWDITLTPKGTSGDALVSSQTISLRVPEPSALALFSSGVLACSLLRRRRTA